MKTTFSKKIHSKLSPTELWKQITAAIHDSAGHPFWPTELEDSKCSRLRVDAPIHVTYKALVKSTNVTYRITSYKPEMHLLHYEASADHPLRGGATIRVNQGINGGSELHWSGAYSYPWYSASGLYMRSYFLNRFFLKLRQGLRQFESELMAKNSPAKVHHLHERRAEKLARPAH